jgi:hypothetical protein
MATPENDPLWFVSFDSLLKILFDEQLWMIHRPTAPATFAEFRRLFSPDQW